VPSTKIPFDAVKAAQANSLILSGIDPELAFQKVGIPEDQYDAYQVTEDINFKLSVVPSGASTGLDEAERADLRARKAAEAEETQARLAENARQKEEARQQAEEARKQQDEADQKAFLAGEAQSARGAAKSDYQAQKLAFLQSQGLENASTKDQWKAISRARGTVDADGTSQFDKFKTTANQDLAAEKEAKQSAAGQTAEAKVVNDQPPAVSGAGQGNNSTAPVAATTTESLSDSEIKNIDNANKGAAAGSTDQDTSNNSNKSESGSDQIAGPDAKIGVGTDNNAAAAPAASVPASLYYNRLHNFTGYTYKITLWLLTTKDYQKITADPDKFTPTHCLISSSGGTPQSTSTDQSSRHPDFLEDFYFDNLSMTTLIGLNSKSKASNAIDLKFTIIEPYGMTLLDRLLSACQTTARCNNYVDQPYLLQVDFLSNPMEANQFGAKGHVIDSKRIPIKFTEFKIKPGAGGTNYFVKAMPYNHLGFVQSVAAVPTTLSVTAKTVGEYFDSIKDLALLFADAAAVVQQQRIETEINKLDIGSISEEELLSLKERLKAELSNVNSFPNGYNTWYRNAANQAKRSDVPLNLILFAIDPDIAKSLIVDVEKSESKRGVFASPIYSALAGTATASAGPDFKNKSVFSVLAGTSVIEVINRIVSASEYIKGQIKNPKKDTEQTTQTDITINDGNARTVSAAGYNKLSTPNQTKKIEYKPTDWFKIIPTIYLGKFDLSTNSYSKAILYTILKYNAANAYHPDMALTKIPPAQVVRTYNYYYTGLNQDIINLDIDFDATFVTGIATFTKQIESSTTVAGADKPKASAAPEPASQPFASTNYVKSVLTPLNSQANPQNQTAEDYSVSSVSRSLYSAYPRGDMLNIRMKIVGDPAFIKQDDIYHNPGQDGYGAVINKVNAPGAPPINESGQIIFDHEEVYVQILVKSAVDIDDATGITNKTVKLSNGQVANGTFSGLYKVMTVESEFKQGKFEQTLSLIRMPDSMIDSTASASTPSSGAIVSTATSTAQPDNVPGVKPAAAVTTSPAAQNAILTGIANGSATSPVPAVATNVNNTQVNIQQQPTPNSTDAIQELAAIDKEIEILDAQTEAANARFQAEIKKIVNNDKLTQVERDKQERALRDERSTPLAQAWLDYGRLKTKLSKIIDKMAPGKTKSDANFRSIGLNIKEADANNDRNNNDDAISRIGRR
jgi:hypothetical protein